VGNSHTFKPLIEHKITLWSYPHFNINPFYKSSLVPYSPTFKSDPLVIAGSRYPLQVRSTRNQPLAGFPLLSLTRGDVIEINFLYCKQMNKAANHLQTIIDFEKSRIRNNYPSEDVAYPLIEIVRALDFYSVLYRNQKNIGNTSYEKFRFGWSLMFKLFYKDLNLDNEISLFSMNTTERRWIDESLQFSGCIQLAQQFLDYCKADFMTVDTDDDLSFQFTYLTKNPGIEYYEKLSLRFYHSLIERTLIEKSKEIEEQLPIIRRKLTGLVNVYYDKFISYQVTDEIDRFYTKLGYLYMMTTQILDDFDESDVFGDFVYKDFLDFAEYLFRAAITHIDCCVALSIREENKIQLRDILTYVFSLETFSKIISEYFKWTIDKTKEIIAVFCIDIENCDFHLSHTGVSPPPLFKLGSDIIMRSSQGCLERPIFFLNKELKRKYPKDYFNAVNKRERRFRQQLYDLFPTSRIIKIQENIVINSNKGSTDIDAVLFDSERKILGLFQLKWQDPFATSMKERYSRMSNLIPKSIEWIDKVSDWLSSNNSQTITKTLRIDKSTDKVLDIHLFVIARNHVHFTNTTLDKRAIWASWFQVIESASLVKDPQNVNPIGELAAKLTFFDPMHRMERDPLPELYDEEFSFSKYTVRVKK
jgi:hypothetical protein